MQGMDITSSCLICNSDAAHSPAQYERHLKKWNFRKNLKNQEWIFVHYRVAKREKAGKLSNVYFNRRLIPKEKVRKETMRHYFPTIQERYGQGITSECFQLRNLKIKYPSPKSKNTTGSLHLYPSGFRGPHRVP
jgi:hypothetical protein